MFNHPPPAGLRANLAHAYRRWGGIDQWPLIKATVIYTEVNRDSEGQDTVTITLRYKPPGGPLSDQFCTKSLTVNLGTTLSPVCVDDEILIYCHPIDQTRIAQEDVSQLVQNIGFLLIATPIVIFLLVMFLTGHFHWGGDD